MRKSYDSLLAFCLFGVLYAFAVEDNIQVINNDDLSNIQIDEQQTPLQFDGPIEEISAIEPDLLTHTATRVRRQILGAEILKVQGLTVKQECDGILLQWDKLSLPFSPNRRSLNEKFKYFNIYRTTSFFRNLNHGLRPFVSGTMDKTLQNAGTDHFKDLYPPINTNLYYAVTVVNGEGQEDENVEPKKVVFVGSSKTSGLLFKLVPENIHLLGKVLHHDTAYNPSRNEYLVTFDLDVNNDALPDHLYALRFDTLGEIVDRRFLNYTANIENHAGNQGWPSVAYNIGEDEYLIAFQFRSGIPLYFSNKYIVISQRVKSSETERAAGPSLLVKANGPRSSTDWVDSMKPLIKYNTATGGYVGAVVVDGGRKEVVGLFVDKKGKVLKALPICNFKGDAFEPNVFIDSKRNESYFTCTVSSGGIANADFKLKSGLTIIVATKKDAHGEHASNTKTADTKNFIGYTNKTLARTSGYYDELADRLILFWEDSDSGRDFLQTASILVTREKYIRDVKSYSCLGTKQVRSPVAVYFPKNHNHHLLWQEPSSRSWAIGGELLQGNLRIQNGREQSDPKVLYNSKLEQTFVSWHEANVVLARQIKTAAQPLCSPICTSGQKCAVQDTCVSLNGDSCAVNKGGCSHLCESLGHWKVRCSCSRLMQLREDGKNCQDIPACHGMTPAKDPDTGREYSCRRGRASRKCPAYTYCHISPDDKFAKCCPSTLPSYSVLVATMTSIWQVSMDTKQDIATFKKVEIGDASILVAVDYNPLDKRVYWSDVDAKQIKRMFLNGVGGVQTILWKDIGAVDGLTIDSEDDYIYWTDVSNGYIERANLDGRSREVILSGLDKPRAIILYKETRSIYWTVWGTTPKIEQANLNGMDRKTIIEGELKWPNGLVIDSATRRLFWADAALDKIETSDLRGKGRRVLLSTPHVHHPYSLAILNNRLFWSDWETSGIHSADKETGDNVVTVAQRLKRPSGFVVFKDNPKVRCRDPGHPTKGNRNPGPDESNYYPQGKVIRFTCYPQYKLFGSVTSICQTGGSWSNKVPECLAPPRLSSIPSNETVRVGENISLPCSSSSPDTTITWYKDGKVVTEDRFSIGEEGLSVETVYVEDRGWYVCNATNKAGTKLARAYVHVVGFGGVNEGLRFSNVNDTILKFKQSDCGKRHFQARARIIGGIKVVTAGAYPWQVSLRNKTTKKHFCGGSLIAEQWVVTAAHCFARAASDLNMEVVLGKRFMHKSEPGKEQVIQPDQIYIHSQYSNDFDYDVALIHLSSPVIYTSYIKPICLPLRETADADETLLRPGNMAVVTGWGRKSENSKRLTAKRLYEAGVPIVNQTVCEQSHSKYIVTSNMFCAGYKDGRADACQGDSGGPLAIENSQTPSDDDERWVLAGIISWGDGCGRDEKFGVYTRVSAVVAWIIETINLTD